MKATQDAIPKSGEPVRFKPKRLPFFKVISELKQRVDGE